MIGLGILAFAAQLSIVAHAPDTVTTCDAVEISVAVSAPGRAVPTVSVPSLAPFDVLRSSAVPHVSYDSRGAGSTTSEYRYLLTTDRVGTFTIPSFETHIGTAVARSRPIDISVHAPSRRGNIPTVVARARVDTSLDVDFRALTRPETVYVGQQANYEVAVFLNAVVRDRLRRNPTFFPPDMQSMLAYDMPVQVNPPRRQVGSHCFDALVYQRALFPLMPGRVAIPPAQLVYSLPLSASFFSREETHELQTDSTIIVAVEPPMTGRPADYNGAVGSVRVSAKLDTNATRVGDPLVLTVKVSGSGNVKLFPRPSVGIAWGTLVKGDERVRVDTTARRISGTKEFDWVLTPKIAGELDVPPIRYPYFNPDSRRYEVTSTNPTRVRIGAGTLANADTARTEMLLKLRTDYRGPARAPIHEHPVFWAFLALVPVPALSYRSRNRVKRATKRAVSAAARLTALAREGATHDASDVRRAYTGALAERLALDPESFTRAGALGRALRRRGVSSDVAIRGEHFLRELDEAAFAANGSLSPDAAARAVKLYEEVNAEALPRTSFGLPALCITGLLAIGLAGTLHAFNAASAREAFDRGVDAYQRHDFVAAREAFIAAATAEPRAPDAWADLGTASWAVADTARSVAAWQRGLRLEPFAQDLRERVELAHSLTWRSAGYVPEFPVSWLFDVAALIWCGTWGVAAYRAAKREPLANRSMNVAICSAVLVVVAAFGLADHLSGRKLGVMRETASLRSDPELGGERGATAIIGEVVRVTGRRGAWSRVVLDDGREGWLESALLVSLDANDAAQMGGD